MLVLIHGSEAMVWKEKEWFRIRAVQMDNLRGLIGIRRMDKIPNTGIKEFCAVTKRVDGRIDEYVLWGFVYVEKMENDRIAKRIYIGECADSYSVGRLRKR